jgi:hypothetical protein
MVPKLVSDPAWEAIKAARSNVAHHEAVQRVAFLQNQYYRMWGHDVKSAPVDINLVLRTLTVKKIPFVLTGTHGISGWMGRPRATMDVDILVKSSRNFTRAVKAVKELYPRLEVRNLAGVTSFFPPGEKESVIDVTYPHRADIAETLAHPVWTEDMKHGLRYRIPSLETALANKYGAMNTITRAMTKRFQDQVDFNWMVIHSEDEGRQPINLVWLEELGELVNPGRCGKEILRLVEEAKSDKSTELGEQG